jgi:HD-GYP domain-containing protein (c-di-GMP phosphodiesterase class II)
MRPGDSTNASGSPRFVPGDGIRQAELIAALSIATDLGMGQQIEYALTTCVLATRLGEALGLGESEQREVYYQALLRFIGCNAETHALAALVGDELALRHDYAMVDPAKTSQVVGLLFRYIRQANQGASPFAYAHGVAQGLLGMQATAKASFAGHCEVGQRLGERLGFGDGIIRALGQLYERWDGRGLPNGLKGEDIELSVRLVTLAQDALTFFWLGGREAALAIARERRGTAYDPRIADCFGERAAPLLDGLADEPSWETVLASEPGPRIWLGEAQFDRACAAIADFADIKSPYTLGHSSGVAQIAAQAARRCGLPASDVTTIRRAGLLHDVGRVGVSTGIWDKPGPLTDREWERVRLHPYYTERVLARPAVLAHLGSLAALHHERLDGSGYHRSLTAAALSPAARILAAADVYHAMIEPRAHRPARAPEEAAGELRRQVRSGRLDGNAVDGVLAAAGHHLRPVRRDLVAGLSEREIEVLRLIAHGNTMKQIAGRLTIVEKTVDNHIQRIYIKIGVSTRAGATLFAMEQDLLDDAG